MNLILFEEDELTASLPLSDPRAEHLLKILKRNPGEEFDAGIIQGCRGKAKIREVTSRGLKILFIPGEVPEPLYPVTLAVGAGRPQTVRKILRETTALGVAAVHFFASGKGDKAYLNSSIYREEHYRPCLIEGAQQAFCTLLPQVEVHGSLGEALRRLGGTDVPSFCLDNYEAAVSLSSCFLPRKEEARSPGIGAKQDLSRGMILWIGSERGWSDKERKIFRQAEIPLVSLGSRILRTETACTAAVTLCLAGLGYL